MSVYTRTGDAGQTRLATGDKVSKSDLRVQLYGEVDELNSHIGLAIAQLESNQSDLKDFLLSEQSMLFEVGSELAGFKPENIECVIYDSDVDRLEAEMDRMDPALPKLQSFVLPGGSAAAASLHIARCVCRRLERQLVQAREMGAVPVHDRLIKFANRLSDYLFVAARYANHQVGESDIKWASRARQDSKKT